MLPVNSTHCDGRHLLDAADVGLVESFKYNQRSACLSIIRAGTATHIGDPKIFSRHNAISIVVRAHVTPSSAEANDAGELNQQFASADNASAFVGLNITRPSH